MENAGYLFATYAIIWALVFGYVLFLIRRQSALKRQIESLKEAARKDRDGEQH